MMSPVIDRLFATLYRSLNLDVAHRYEGVLPETRLNVLAASTGKLHSVRIDRAFAL
jgi:hypothetical protein